MNDALLRAILDNDLDEADVAAHLDVDPKTVRAWISGRVPYPRHRRRAAKLLQRDEGHLWPQVARQTTPDLRAAYGRRSAIPRETWLRFFTSATREIGILAYAGLFLAEDAGLRGVLAERARAGVAVRILLGDPDNAHVQQRGADEGIGDAMAAKIRNALILYQPLREVDGVQIRLHRTVLYASIYRADDDLLANPHAYGAMAANAPVLHLHVTSDDDMAAVYLDSFERIWTEAAP